MTYQVGVDLGATFTAAAVCRSGRADVVPFGPRAAFLPSVAYVNPDGSLVLGEPAEQRALIEPDRVARQFTRRVGDGTPLRLGGVSMTADALAARFVAYVVGSVAGMVGGPAARVALTHPAGWGQHRLASLHSALTAQGLGGTVFLTGAQAAARAYGEQVPVSTGDLIAVYDLGGSGFDAAVVRKLPDGQYALAGRAEELEIGGLDFDELVFDHVRVALGDRWNGMNPADPAVRPALARLRRDCALAKEALSADTDVQIPVSLPGIDARVRLARAEFEEMIRPTVEETAATLHRAIDAAGSAPEDVSAVLLTGGSARIPLVTQVVSEVLGRPVTVAPNPKADTAIGAALAIGGPDPALVAAPAAPVEHVEPEQTRIVLRAAPAAAPTPVRPPVPLALAAPATSTGRFGLSRTFAAAAAAATALVVGGGILLASNSGPRGAGADPHPAGTTSSTEQTVTTRPETTTTQKKPASTPRRTAEPPVITQTEEPQPEEPVTPSDPPESSSSTPPVEDNEPVGPTDPTEPTETTTTTTSPETAVDPPAAEAAVPGPAERPQS